MPKVAQEVLDEIIQERSGSGLELYLTFRSCAQATIWGNETGRHSACELSSTSNRALPVTPKAHGGPLPVLDQSRGGRPAPGLKDADGTVPSPRR